MQIMPSGGNWNHAASASQQSIADIKHVHAVSNRTSNKPSVNPLEQTANTSDRDANERYDGPQQQANPSSANEQVAEPENHDSMLTLPAIDDSPSSSLDLMG
jgi:hypothetical protein